MIGKDANRSFIVTCNWCSRQFSMKLSRAREHLGGYGKKVKKFKLSSLRYYYIFIDVTVVCYDSMIIVLSSLLSCVLSSVRVIGKESLRAQLSELSRIPHRPKFHAPASPVTGCAGTWCVKHRACSVCYNEAVWQKGNYVKENREET